MTLQREKATQVADLPHRYDKSELGHCTVCHREETDARHAAWEREQAAEQHPTPTFARELGT